ncbi:MFS transporter [Rhizobium sp. Leaf391]|uniref:MFS transporter n=1 Tax=Rhizobium sp. Leaf391 TaxID=1736360 RepID=UPI000A67F485|nr:MFS transporter [Rhizobium sp. Leaf391]
MDDRKLPVSALWGLGLTQITGYGTLYYAFSILVPDIARQLGWSEQWVFGAFSGSLLAGSLVAPTAGHWADRIGAGRLMAVGSVGAAISLLLTAAAPGPITFCLALALTQNVSATVLYSTAFVAIVQIGGREAQKSIVHLALIAGFASTLFWPLTSWLSDWISWRQVYLLFALLNIGICFPIHLWLARLSSSKVAGEQPAQSSTSAVSSTTPSSKGQLIFVLMLIGFAIEGYALSAVLVHMVPLTLALGLGASGIYIASLFGPSHWTVTGREPFRQLAVRRRPFPDLAGGNRDALSAARPGDPAPHIALDRWGGRLRNLHGAGFRSDQHCRRHTAFGAVWSRRLRQASRLVHLGETIHVRHCPRFHVGFDVRNRCRSLFVDCRFDRYGWGNGVPGYPIDREAKDGHGTIECLIPCL